MPTSWTDPRRHVARQVEGGADRGGVLAGTGARRGRGRRSRRARRAPSRRGGGRGGSTARRHGRGRGRWRGRALDDDEEGAAAEGAVVGGPAVGDDVDEPLHPCGARHDGPRRRSVGDDHDREPGPRRPRGDLRGEPPLADGEEPQRAWADEVGGERRAVLVGAEVEADADGGSEPVEEWPGRRAAARRAAEAARASRGVGATVPWPSSEVARRAAACSPRAASQDETDPGGLAAKRVGGVSGAADGRSRWCARGPGRGPTRVPGASSVVTTRAEARHRPTGPPRSPLGRHALAAAVRCVAAGPVTSDHDSTQVAAASAGAPASAGSSVDQMAAAAGSVSSASAREAGVAARGLDPGDERGEAGLEPGAAAASLRDGRRGPRAAGSGR